MLKYNLLSTIYPEDPVITQLFQAYCRTDIPGKELVAVLKQCREMSPLLAIQYMPIIIQVLLELMVARDSKEPGNPSQEAFKALILVLHKYVRHLALPRVRRACSSTRC